MGRVDPAEPPEVSYSRKRIGLCDSTSRGLRNLAPGGSPGEGATTSLQRVDIAMPTNRFELEGRPAPSELITDVILQLTSHASVRSYRPDPLPEGVVEVIVTAAQSASTSSNLQNYSIIAVQDPERRRLLAELSENAHVAEAPLFLVFCPDLRRMELICEKLGYPFADRGMEMFIQAVVDTALAAQNAAVAAESLGLGICMIGGIRNQTAKVAELLHLPPRTFALVGMTVGYPAAPAKLRHRLPLDVVLHREVYCDENLWDGLRRYDEVTARSGIYAGRQLAPAPGSARAPQTAHESSGVQQQAEPRLYGWTEHSARRMARPNAKRANMKVQLEALGWEF